MLDLRGETQMGAMKEDIEIYPQMSGKNEIGNEERHMNNAPAPINDRGSAYQN